MLLIKINTLGNTPIIQKASPAPFVNSKTGLKSGLPLPDGAQKARTANGTTQYRQMGSFLKV